jgi:hypothetical protein
MPGGIEGRGTEQGRQSALPAKAGRDGGIIKKTKFFFYFRCKKNTHTSPSRISCDKIKETKVVCGDYGTNISKIR